MYHKIWPISVRYFNNALFGKEEYISEGEDFKFSSISKFLGDFFKSVLSRIVEGYLF